MKHCYCWFGEAMHVLSRQSYVKVIWGEYGWSGGGLTTLEIIQNERLIEL